MIAYKGFTKDLTARLGQGNYQFKPGETEVEKSSKTARSGFHCCENPFECLGYYSLKTDDQFWQVEASGSIDEDDCERIACTEITLIKKLTVKEFAGYGMAYIVQHPMRDRWEQKTKGIVVARESAEADESESLAIARGQPPKVQGVEGAILGLILEPKKGEIISARLFVPDRQQAGKWYTIDENRNLQEVKDEKKAN